MSALQLLNSEDVLIISCIVIAVSIYTFLIPVELKRAAK